MFNTQIMVEISVRMWEIFVIYYSLAFFFSVCICLTKKVLAGFTTMTEQNLVDLKKYYKLITMLIG